MKRVLSAILTIVLILSCLSTITFFVSAAPAELKTELNQFTLVDQNSNLALYLDSNTGDFAVMNQKSGTIWYSNPVDRQHDKIAQGDTFEELDAKISIKYLTSNYSTVNTNSKTASIIAERQGKDQILTFYFKGSTTNFTIPIKLSLREDYLHLEVMIDKIKEMGDSRIVYIKVYQLFGAAGLNDTGYGLMPDGSGSLMTFNANVENTYEFGGSTEGSFYGVNPTEVANQAYFTNWNESVRLPIYGMVKNNDAYLNVIESGAAISELRAYISRYKNSYNTMFTCINVRDTQTRMSSTGKSGSGSYYTDELPENYIARYYFLNGSKANYIGMAERYRQYLIDEKGMQPVKEVASNNLNISLYGAVQKAKHFLGIPYTGIEDLTDYSEAEALIDRLKDDNINKVLINYLGWSSGGLESTIDTDFSPASILGGKKAINRLIKKANDENVLLSFDADLQAFYGGRSNIKKFKNTAYGLDSSPVTIYRGRISVAGALDKKNIAYQLIHPLDMLGYAEEFIKNASAWEVKSFSFGSIGESLYCAYNLQNTCTRDQSANTMEEIFKSAAEATDGSGIVTTRGGNAYALPYVDNVLDSPVYGSHNNIAVQEIPFYQIVFRGYVNLASSAVNLNSEQNDLILHLAETATSLYYVLMDADSTAFQDTNFTSSFACNLDDHYDEMVAAYNKLKPVYDAVGASSIQNHQILSVNLKVTTFSNGAKIYVNYGADDITTNGVTVKAGDFTVVGGGNA